MRKYTFYYYAKSDVDDDILFLQLSMESPKPELATPKGYAEAQESLRLSAASDMEINPDDLVSVDEETFNCLKLLTDLDDEEEGELVVYM